METFRHTNELIHETSPYLHQHAHNPVNWMAWGEEAFNKAGSERKLLLISIGYAACHWCHVMEHESFEDEEVADIMNRHYVSIKVDREERPDVDQIYMTAVQLMKQQGGWPLNIIALPDGRPIWGGTYFPRKSWIEALQQIAVFHQQNPEQTREYAEKLSRGIEQSALVPLSNKESKPGLPQIQKAVRRWQSGFDMEEGGSSGAPKFMMPGNLLFLLRWSHGQRDPFVEKFIRTTLQKMAFGGIYDQVGGGFARYSTDPYWKVPHFEKMLYDNGQLLSLYAQAYQKFQDPLYYTIVDETISWMKREMRSSETGFYSSLDADSEGEEGKFYVWQKPEIRRLIGNDFDLFADYFNINQTGHWEDGKYILFRKEADDVFARRHQLEPEELVEKIHSWKKKLLQERSNRVRPGLDDKILTSWNALVITGLVHAYRAFGKSDYLQLARQNARFLLEKQLTEDGTLLHSHKNGISKINGFLEDYALLIQALIALFEVTGNESDLYQAQSLTKTVFKRFFDPAKGIFYFTPIGQGNLISRSIEVYDNVIPSSNSVMAGNLVRLGHLLEQNDYLQTAMKMLSIMSENCLQYPSGHSGWLNVALSFANEQFEIAIAGPEAISMGKEMQARYLPNCLFCPGETSSLPLLKDRIKPGETLIYVCKNQTCLLPVKTPEEALKLIQER